MVEAERNLERYTSPEVVEHFAQAEGLEAVEQQLFGKYLRPESDILDLGVGGGRTTPYLARLAARYVGIDFSPEMIAACRTKFPEFTFEVCDASDLSSFEDASFDAAVFAFNGIDYLHGDEARRRSLSEIARVLVDGGIFIFSSHHARALAVSPQLATARGIRIPWRIVRAAVKSVGLARRHVGSGAFRAGEGYILDPSDGGLWTYVSTPATLLPQLNAVGLAVLEVVGGRDSQGKPDYLVPWHYYACRKVQS